MLQPRCLIGIGRRTLVRPVHAHVPATTRAFHALHGISSTSASPGLRVTTLCQATTKRTTSPGYRLHLGSKRSFSVAPAVDAAVSSTQSLFSMMHYTLGTPWYLTIPVIALSVTLVARIPLAIYARRVQQRRATLIPLSMALAMNEGKAALNDPAFGALSQARKEVERRRRLGRAHARLFKEFGVQRWKDYVGIAVFPVWLVGIEALRRLCAGPTGLLGSLISGHKAASGMATSTSGAAGDTALEVGRDLVASGADFSLSTGGCLWFPDLMAADPWHILPFAVSAVMILNIAPRTQSALRNLLLPSDTPATGQFRVRLTRALIIAAAAIGPVTMNLPAALHLYWLTTSTLALVVNELMTKTMPLNARRTPLCRHEMPYVRPRRTTTKAEDSTRM